MSILFMNIRYGVNYFQCEAWFKNAIVTKNNAHKNNKKKFQVYTLFGHSF